jgi:hypothetical protein
VRAGLIVIIGVAISRVAAAQPEMAEWLLPVPTLELATSFLAGERGAPTAPRTATVLLRAHSEEEFLDLSFEAAVGWLTFSENGGAGQEERSSRLGNIFGAGHFRWAQVGGRWQETLGLGLLVGSMGSSSRPGRLAGKAAAYALAVNGLWDSWMWTPASTGLIIPVSLQRLHQLGPRPGCARLEAALIGTLGVGGRSSSVTTLVQVGASEELALWRRLTAGARAHFVWIPDGLTYHGQIAGSPYVAVGLGPWRFEAEAVLNLSAPYGFLGGGRSLWALGLKAGVTL